MMEQRGIQGDEMKALTLTQPWVTLVAIGAKQIETRSWATKYRGPIAIHAGVGLGPVGGSRALRELIRSQPFFDNLIPIVVRVDEQFPIESIVKSLPFGAVIATANLTAVHCIPATPMHFPRGVPESHMLASYPIVLPPFQDDQERAFGDYTPGRYAWVLSDVEELSKPIPARGALGLWEWNDQEGTGNES